MNKAQLKKKSAAVKAAIEKRDLDLAAIEAAELDAEIARLHEAVQKALEESRALEQETLAEIERLRKARADRSPWEKFLDWFNE